MAINELGALLGLPDAPRTRRERARNVAPRTPPRAARDRERLRRSFRRFVERYWRQLTGHDFPANPIALAIVAALQDLADGRGRPRLAIACPPSAGKTTLLALYAAWRFARDPSWKIIAATHAAPLAETQSRAVRRLVESDDYAAMFPAIRIREDESTVSHWALTAGGRYIATSAPDGAILGRRCNEAIIDDPSDAVDRFSPAALDRTWEWFVSSLTSRIDGVGSIVCCHQRIAKQDMIGRLLAGERVKWELVELPAEDEHGNLLGLPLLTRERLDAERERSPTNYACMFLQRPSDDSASAVKRMWWRFYRPRGARGDAPVPPGCDATAPVVGAPDRYSQLAIVMDPTFGGTKKTNDHAAIQVWGRREAPTTKRQMLYLVERWAKRATILEQTRALKDLMAAYPSAKVYIEKSAGGHGLIQDLLRDGVQVHEVVASRSKDERIGLASPAIEEGRVLLPLGAAYCAEVIEQCAGSLGNRDDDQDCVAMAIKVLSDGASAPTAPSWVDIFDPGRRARQEAREQQEQWHAEQQRSMERVAARAHRKRNAPAARCDRCRAVEDIDDAIEFHGQMQRKYGESWWTFAERERLRDLEVAARAKSCERCAPLEDAQVKEYIDAPYDEEADEETSDEEEADSDDEADLDEEDE